MHLTVLLGFYNYMPIHPFHNPAPEKKFWKRDSAEIRSTTPEFVKICIQIDIFNDLVSSTIIAMNIPMTAAESITGSES